MTVSNYGKELAEMMTLWDFADERQTIQHFLHAVYILRGNRPSTTGEFINHLSDDDLARAYVATMDDSRKEQPTIDLLDIQPTRV